MENYKKYFTNILLQLLFLVLVYKLYGTIYAQPTMFFSNFLGPFASFIGYFLIKIYLVTILLTLLLFVFDFKKWNNFNVIIILTILSIPLAGWFSISNAFVIYWILKKT